jgi:ketosteroid isomerase-like protein
MMSNIETVKAIYEAFGKGDFNFILDQLADDVVWEGWADNYGQKAGVAWLQEQRGKAGAADFFQLTTTMEVNRFDVLSILEGENQIAAEVVIGCKYFLDEEMHLWNFNDQGKVTRLRHYADTAKHIAGAEKYQAATA